MKHAAALCLLLGTALPACAVESTPPDATGGTAGSSLGSAGVGGTGTGGSAGTGTGGSSGGSGGSAGASTSTGGAGGTAGTAGTGGTGGGSAGSGGTAGSGGAGAASGEGGMAGAAAGGAGSGAGGAGSGGGAGMGAGGGSAGESAGKGGGAGQGGAAGSAGSSGGPTLPPITDYRMAGPFPTTVQTGQGPGGGYTIYRPTTLGEDGFLHAPIVFGPGIGQQVSVHTMMLTNFASHGFVVVGTPVLNGGPGDDGNLQKMRDGLDWIVQQNSAAGIFQGKIWVDHAVSMGFSVGGTSAVELGGHAAVATVVSIHGHTATADLHGTMLQTTGTQDTVGLPLQQNTYNQSEVPTFMATLTGANHGYIERNGGGDERPAILAWMRYWIYGDMGARSYFFGNDCVLCKAPWENPQRKNWP